MPSLKASSRLDFGVIPNGDDFSVPQHPEQPVGPRVIPVRGPAMGNLRAALATVMIHAARGGRAWIDRNKANAWARLHIKDGCAFKEKLCLVLGAS